MDFRAKNVLVIGTGLSGVGAIHLIHQVGGRAILLDQNEKSTPEGLRAKLDPEDQDFPQVVIGDLTDEQIAALDLCVPSPAVPADSPFMLRVKAAGVKIISEIELGYLFEKGRILAITGTNGKTTTTTLVGDIVRAYQDQKKNKTFVVGNIGFSYAGIATQTDEKSMSVGEISSFQLELIDTFHPVVSAILNITPDHLNRHHTMENYIACKENITKNQTAADTCVLNYEDPVLRAFGESQCPASVQWFSSKQRVEQGFYLDGNMICQVKDGVVTELMDYHDMRLVGLCNVENVMAAMAITSSAGIPMDLILQVIHDFPPVEHRIEFVETKRGVDYYNDSKATNPDAAVQGIRAMEKPTVLIGGGFDKQNTYDEWIEAFDGKVKELVLIGQTAQDIAKCARAHGFTNITFCDTYKECLEHCTAVAKEGDAVLLSPACASWGMFPNYEVRGEQFKEYVRSL